MSKKELKKKNTELNENDLENVSGGIVLRTPIPNSDGTWSINDKTYKSYDEAYKAGNPNPGKDPNGMYIKYGSVSKPKIKWPF